MDISFFCIPSNFVLSIIPMPIQKIHFHFSIAWFLFVSSLKIYWLVYVVLYFSNLFWFFIAVLVWLYILYASHVKTNSCITLTQLRKFFAPYFVCSVIYSISMGKCNKYTRVWASSDYCILYCNNKTHAMNWNIDAYTSKLIGTEQIISCGIIE